MNDSTAYLSTEKNNPRTRQIDQCSTEEILRLINQEDHRVPDAVEAAIPMITLAVDGIVERLSQGGRLFYIGAGTSGRLGVLDASECPPTFGTSPDMVVGIIAGGQPALSCAVEGVEDSVAAGIADLKKKNISAKDALVGIAASGRTPYVMSALDYARNMGVFTVGLSNSKDADLAKVSDVIIEVVTGAEVIMGSTRMKAGTAQKLVLNMLSTGTMIRLGKVYQNYMVDLMASNEKLHDRSVRIVCQVTGVESELAKKALLEAEGSVKTAICMLVAGMDATHAADLLANHNGILRNALESLK